MTAVKGGWGLGGVGFGGGEEGAELREDVLTNESNREGSAAVSNLELLKVAQKTRRFRTLNRTTSRAGKKKKKITRAQQAAPCPRRVPVSPPLIFLPALFFFKVEINQRASFLFLCFYVFFF